MTKYIIQRVIWVFIILVTTLTIQFVLLKTAPEYPPSKNDQKDQWLEHQVSDGYYTREYYDVNNPDDMRIVNEIRDSNPDLNKTVFVVNPVNDSDVIKVFYRVPIFKQYTEWVKNIVTDWNWGTSTKIKVNAPAFSIISKRMPLTLTLNLAALVFYLPFGFAFGILAALKKDTLTDNIMQIVIMVFLSIPNLILIIILVMLFGYQWEILPTLFPLIGIESGQKIAEGYVIPVLSLGLPAIASLTRLLRAELSEVLTSEFVLLAKTKGLSHAQAVIRHAIRNSLVPMVPIIIGSFALLLSGSFIMERVYAVPGVGLITLRALTPGQYDFNVILVSGAFYGVIGLFTSLIVDLSYGLVDPRIRMGARK